MTIMGAAVTVEKAAYADLQQDAQRAMSRDWPSGSHLHFAIVKCQCVALGEHVQQHIGMAGRDVERLLSKR